MSDTVREPRWDEVQRIRSTPVGSIVRRDPGPILDPQSFAEWYDLCRMFGYSHRRIMRLWDRTAHDPLTPSEP